MAIRDNNDIDFELTTGEPRKRQIGKLPKPLIRLIALVAALIVLIVIIVVAARGCGGEDEAAVYANYMTSLESILADSDAVGAELAALLTAPGDTNRTEIQAKLDEYIAASEDLEVEANALEAPKELVERGLHQWLLLVMAWRQTGVTALKPALMGALEVEDTEVPAEQILHALRYLTSSDFLYEEEFLPRTADLLAEKNLSGVNVPSSQFLTDPNLASEASVLSILAGLRTAGVLLPVHGVGLKKVVAMPDDKEITENGTFNLTATNELVFVVTVENQGNMDEQDVKVTVTLSPSDSTEQPQEVTFEITELKAKTETAVEIKGLSPTAYGEVALLHVQAGPVEEEKYAGNNEMEAKVIFKL
jgi:CARDB